jgi:protein involved in polysaccharide export with SLBB domain
MKALILYSLIALAPVQAEEKPAPKVPASVPVVTVGGQVRTPGPVAYRKGLKLYEAIQTAEGITEFGAERRVRVIRDGKTTAYDLYDEKQKLIPLQENDIIEVPQKNMCGEGS